MKDSLSRLLKYSKELETNLEEIMVRIKDCISVRVGPVDARIVSALEEKNFDQAPVFLDDNFVLGGITTKRLKHLLESGKELLKTDNDIRLNEIYSPCCSLIRLLEFFSEHSFGFVCAELDDDETGTTYHMVRGLITISDLNKHYVRSLVYILLSKLETLIATFIKTLSDPSEWLDKMNEETLVRILGYWELSKRRNVDIGPIEACSISDLFNIISKNEKLRRNLSYVSRNAFDDATGRIPMLRNSIMHPVRPMVVNSKDVISLRETIERVVELVTRLESLRRRKIMS